MSGNIDRRAVLRGSGIGACTLALAACTTDRGEPEAADPEAGVVLLQLSDLPVGSAKVVTTEDDAPVAVVRSGEKEVHAFSGVCTHQGCTIEAEKKQFQCPCHGSQFAFADGSVQHGPAEQPLPEIEVGIENGAVVTR
ncbi:MAG TPA: Rieske (2Fe-2S) protein [Ruania sp.]|nr:Rieske (2Fe-2S) protein [Ruania sp.]